jgi:hypothetical protein
MYPLIHCYTLNQYSTEYKQTLYKLQKNFNIIRNVIGVNTVSYVGKTLQPKVQIGKLDDILQ